MLWYTDSWSCGISLTLDIDFHEFLSQRWNFRNLALLCIPYFPADVGACSFGPLEISNTIETQLCRCQVRSKFSLPIEQMGWEAKYSFKK